MTSPRVTRLLGARMECCGPNDRRCDDHAASLRSVSVGADRIAGWFRKCIAHWSRSAGAAAASHGVGELLARFQLEYMLAAARTHVSADDGPWGCHVHHGDPHNVIPRVARELACDLLVVGTSVRRGLAAMLIGSTAAELSRAVACDVLLVPMPTRVRMATRVHALPGFPCTKVS
jgi:nucleotide-binding universal stress UspA family protein